MYQYFDLRLIKLDLFTQKLLFTHVLSLQYSIVTKILMFYMSNECILQLRTNPKQQP